MHILLIVQNNSFPSDRRVSKEARSLKEAGYEVSAISPAIGKDSSNRDKWNGIDIYRYCHFESIGGMSGFIVEYANALIRIFFISLGLFVRKPFRSIHVANPPDFFWPMALFFKLLGVKFIFDQHDISAEMYRVNEQANKNTIYRFLNWNEQMTIRCANGVITTNTSIRDRLDALYGLRGTPNEVVYNGPAAEFKALPDSELEKCYVGKKVLLYVGEIALMDSVEVVLDVAREIVQKQGRTDCVFILLGDGPDRARLESLAKERGLSGYVEFKGMVSHQDVMRYLHLAKACLVPDEPNGLNEFLTLIKCFEYMKAARPFVAFDLKETRFVAAESALFSSDLREYVQHVLWLIDASDKAVLMGEAGKVRVESSFLWEHQVPQLKKLYDQVLKV